MPKNVLGNALDALEKVEEKKEDTTVEETTEEKKEEVHSNIEDKIKKESKEVSETTEEAPKFTDELFLQYANEKLDKKAESIEDLFVKIEVEKIVEKDREYLSDFTKNYENYFKETNRPPQDFINLNRDIESLTKEQVVKETLAKNNPSLSASDVNFLYSDTYSIDKDTMDEVDIHRREIKFKTDYDRSVREMKSDKDKFLKPLENSIASREANKLEQAKQIEDGAKLWAENVNISNEALKSIEIDLGDDVKYTHSVDPNISKDIKDIASDNTMQKWQAQYSDESGALDTSRIQRDLYLNKNINNLLKEAYNQGVANATEGIAKTDKNIDFKSDNKVIPKKVLSKEAEQVRDLLSATYKNKRR